MGCNRRDRQCWRHRRCVCVLSGAAGRRPCLLRSQGAEAAGGFGASAARQGSASPQPGGKAGEAARTRDQAGLATCGPRTQPDAGHGGAAPRHDGSSGQGAAADAHRSEADPRRSRRGILREPTRPGKGKTTEASSGGAGSSGRGGPSKGRRPSVGGQPNASACVSSEGWGVGRWGPWRAAEGCWRRCAPRDGESSRSPKHPEPACKPAVEVIDCAGRRV
mmetsp:Transcript_11594/g.45048  ORF Transcript_11594/g.45048 Transcript_11594/m.45048 type:complete len:220 (+) Transcript_11594:1285-1944(+)